MKDVRIKIQNYILSILKDKKLISQITKYLVVGVTSFIMEYLLFAFLFIIIKANVIIANSCAYFIVFCYNFILNRLWTFNSKENLIKQLILYGALLLINLSITNSLLYFLTNYYKIYPLVSKLFVMILIILWNFIIYKKLIYK